MATLDQLSKALVNADAVGDTAAARALAAEIRRMSTMQTPELDPTEGMSTFEKGAAGFGKAIVDTGRGIGQMLGVVSRADVEEARKRDRALMNTGSGMAGNIAGNLAMFAPTAMIPGANTITGGAAIGAGLGLVQPSASSGETLGNVALGGVLGGAVPAITRTIQAARSAAEPLTDKGKNAIIGRVLNSAAGDRAPEVAQRLRAATELVPGSRPTVGQAAENAAIAALERSAVATNPAVTTRVSETMRAQQAARRSLLDELSGADGARLFATEARDATAEQLYGAARKAGIDPAALTPEAQANIAAFAQRVPEDVMAYAKRLARISGEPMDNTTSVQGLHWVKKAIDGLIGQAQRSGDSTAVRAYTGLQNDLLAGLDQMSPAYAAARGTFREMSKPINQMETVDVIRRAAVDPLHGNVMPKKLATSLSDASARRATGMPTATLQNTLDEPTLNALNALREDVRRADAALNAGRGPGSDTVQKLAYTNMLEQAGVPTFMRNFSPAQLVGNLGARAGDLVYARANRELANRLAETMLDPQQAGLLMSTVPEQRNMLLKTLLQRGGSGLALSSPALANAQK